MVSHISKLSAIRKAGRWQRAGAKWHFHLLSPGCLFNPAKWHELYLESSHGNFLVRSHKPLIEIARQLARILTSKTVVERSTSASSAKVKKILQRAQHLNHKKVYWHHHLLFPHCMFNKKWGKWVNLFEDPLNNSVIEIFYPHFPAADLKKIDGLFYSQNPKR